MRKTQCREPLGPIVPQSLPVFRRAHVAVGGRHGLAGCCLGIFPMNARANTTLTRP
jgi:hypothetical protein